MAQDIWNRLTRLYVASVAGHNLANSLYPTLPSTHRILLIDALDYGFFPIACLRAAVVPGELFSHA